MAESSDAVRPAGDVPSSGSGAFQKLLVAMSRTKASELYLRAGEQPTFRIGGTTIEMGGRAFSLEEVQRLLREAMSAEQAAELDREQALEFPYAIPGIGSFTIHAFLDSGVPSCAVRNHSEAVDTKIVQSRRAGPPAPGTRQPGLPAAETPRENAAGCYSDGVPSAVPSGPAATLGSNRIEERSNVDDLKDLANLGKPEEPSQQQWKAMEKLFIAMTKNRASDLHLKPGMRPSFRIATVLHDVGNRPLQVEETKRMIYEILTEAQIEQYERELDLDFAYSIPGYGRYRINIFHDRGVPAMAVRRVNTEIPTFEALNLPPGVKRIPTITQGLVIVAGATGSGKSTTLASVLNYINETRRCHIITVEDPIEYLFDDKKSFINQREVGIDVTSFQSALKHIVRQNPDVILVGEMRDHASFDAALQAAETGHLVFGTIHASSSAQTIGRILDLFPTERQDLIRQGLVFNLKGVVCQKLLPSCKEGVRMVPAVEVMIVNSTIQKLIATKDDKKISDVVRGGAEEGMQDFNQGLVALINQGLITKKVGLAFSPNPEQLKMNLQGIYLGEDHKILGG